MKHHKDYVTHVNNEEDIDILTRPLFDVNMRLYSSCEEYRSIVRSACNFLVWWATTKKEGYKMPHGVSGANVGIPFNIIVINRTSGPCLMINPKIIRYYGRDIESKSNCGSITLDEPIIIFRKEFIDISYFTIDGNQIFENKVSRKEAGLTIQHEVDHNLGILITDRTKID